MTTLPPEGADGQATGGQPASNIPPVPPVPPAAPAPPAPPVPPAAQPAAPQQPQYQVPPQQPQYQTPPQQPQGGYAPPPAPGGYAQPPISDPVSNITLNYWLSVFFSWIPALIFYLIEKDKGNAQVRAYHADNLNFTLLRIGTVIAAYIVGFILLFIPYVGPVISIILIWAGILVPFIFHIIAAAKAPESFRRGEKPPFIFNIQMIK
ncbi:DUF4870 domain-containing protein [Leucobacter coleopterorum]|uniref:DUF4870 domain-containing protein n=1 Tax=Leucobacter coleopterorum TaxID=2714933 RepID=A0ABX6JU25_9MICO|nr:DUF4870 domain-containing protein [Leucobacter coleopterorum]QIM17788.1 DUF4870 domain-containing protein [Leucobacter coleopterorum]